MATMRDVAARAGVSASTVSRVFNGDARVRPEHRTRVEAAIAELGYVPNTLATTFRNGRAPVIGLAVPDIVDPFFAAIAQAAEQVAARHGMFLMISILGEVPEREQPIVEALLGRQVSGLIIAPITADQAYLEAWSDRVPLVFVDREPAGLRADYFVEDDEQGGHTATAHLIGRGHRRIAFLGDTLDLATTRHRRDGYRRALQEAGIEADDDLVVRGADTGPGARAAVERLQALAEPPTAVFSSNIFCSMHLVPALAGRRWAVTAFGDFPMANLLSPTLTVIDQDPASLGARAAGRAIDRMTAPGRRYRRRNVLPVTLVQRESSGPPTG